MNLILIVLFLNFGLLNSNRDDKYLPEYKQNIHNSYCGEEKEFILELGKLIKKFYSHFYNFNCINFLLYLF